MCYYMSAYELNVSKALSVVANTVSVINPALGDPGVKENTDATTFKKTSIAQGKMHNGPFIYSGLGHRNYK